MMIVVLIIGLLLAIAVPNFVNARTLSRAQAVCSELNEIATAKNEFIMVRALKPGDPVNDAADLVPTYLNFWPTGPIPGTYAANAVGSDPTFNGQNAAWYTQHCTGTTADSSCSL
jgi:Tfp pilus assembly protein PilE